MAKYTQWPENSDISALSRFQNSTPMLYHILIWGSEKMGKTNSCRKPDFQRWLFSAVHGPLIGEEGCITGSTPPSGNTLSVSPTVPSWYSLPEPPGSKREPASPSLSG